MPLTVARGRIVEPSFEGAASVACNGLSPPSCCRGIQKHVRVARSIAGVPRWQVTCVQSAGSRQHLVGGRCSRSTLRRRSEGVGAGEQKEGVYVYGIRLCAGEWDVLAITRTAGRRTPKFHRSARTWASLPCPFHVNFRHLEKIELHKISI